MRVRPEVPHALALVATHDSDARELLVESDCQIRVALVVAVANVKPRVVLLDPRVLELQRFDFGIDAHPVDGRSRGDHALRAHV